MQTNQKFGKRFDTGIEAIDATFGSKGVFPLIAITPGMKAGQVKLHLTESEESPDVIQVAALFDKHTMHRIVSARIEHSIARTDLNLDALRESLRGEFKVQFNRNYEHGGGNGELRFHLTIQQNGKSKMKSLEAALASAFIALGKAQSITIRHKSEVDKPETVSVSINQEKLLEGAQKLSEKFSAEAFIEFAGIITAMAMNVQEANEILDASEVVA